MRELSMKEIEAVGGGEAGVPHSNYYYGDSTAPAGASTSFIQWWAAFLGEWSYSTP